MTTITTAISNRVQNAPSLQSDQKIQSTVSIRDAVTHYLQHHFNQLWAEYSGNDLYEKFLSEIEPPLLEMTLQYCHHNQVQAAKHLGLSRGTLRKKMRRYGILKNKNQAAE